MATRPEVSREKFWQFVAGALGRQPELQALVCDARVTQEGRAAFKDIAGAAALSRHHAELQSAPMPDAPEIPEASNASEKKIALTIAILAVVLSLVDNLGDNAKTDAIIKTNEASNQWSYYQAKSIKGHLAEMHAGLLTELGGSSPSDAARQSLAKLTVETERENNEKAAIQKQAKDLQQQAAQQSKVNDRCDLSALILQIGIVVCSVAILSEWKPFWYVGIVLGLVGTIFGVTAFLM